MTVIEPRRVFADSEMYEVAPRQNVRGHLNDIYRYRELLKQLVRRELKVKYQNSTLGFAWSMLNPAFLMLIYWLVFSFFLKNNQPNFPIWILCGLLPWNFFSGGLVAGTSSITNNSYLVGKVRFPREILPLAAVGAALIHFFLQLTVLIGAMVVFRYRFDWAAIGLVLPSILTALMLCAALAMLLSAINVYARDTQHLLELLILAWFWLTPILVPYMGVASQLERHKINGNLLLLNPMASVVISMQRALYSVTGTARTQIDPATGKAMIDKVTGKAIVVTTRYLPDASLWWYLRNVSIVFAVSTVLMVAAIKVFDRAEGNFAEVM
jgi:ABC-2 type transport system permease protein